MNYYEAFSYLGITVTKDVSEIKKSYQKLLAIHHPEEDPQGFMALHQAYKDALAYAQGKSNVKIVFDPFVQEEKNIRDENNVETEYDSIFHDLEENKSSATSADKETFSREMKILRLHWLPIPLKRWRSFFGGEAYLRNRGEAEQMEELFELLLRKIHSYAAFLFILNCLWELVSWQKNEGMETLAVKTKKCISELCKQYSHYMKLDTDHRLKVRVFPALWYYQALPFYFRLLVSMFILPLISFGSKNALALLVVAFYAMEIFIWIRKGSRQLGIFRPVCKTKKGSAIYKVLANGDLFVIATIHAIFIHIAFVFLI